MIEPPSPSSDSPWLVSEDRRTLLEVTHDSIGHGLRFGRPLPVDPSQYAPALQVNGATFVTLKIDGQLRGCIGGLVAVRPLVADVAEHAYGAAFRDQRFAPVTPAEREYLAIQLSLLSAAQPMRFENEQHLIAQLRPGVDGLILENRTQRGTFLPAVWAQLPQPQQFLDHLKRKAGLDGPDLSGVKVSRYTVWTIS